jgi:hypothetical protein
MSEIVLKLDFITMTPKQRACLYALLDALDSGVVAPPNPAEMGDAEMATLIDALLASTNELDQGEQFRLPELYSGLRPGNAWNDLHPVDRKKLGRRFGMRLEELRNAAAVGDRTIELTGRTIRNANIYKVVNKTNN